jgi:hypothetical protein
MSALRKKFLEGVKKIRESVEDFKDEHKMASEAISTGIDMLPEPFNKVASIIWNGMEKKDEDSAAELLNILERIEASNKKSFEQIGGKLQTLLDRNASKEDIRVLGELIRTSNQPVIDLVNSRVDELLARMEKLEKEQESFSEILKTLNLQSLDLQLVTASTPTGKADILCWEQMRFKDAEIKSDYYARRPMTDDVIDSVSRNEATIVYGDPYTGKSMLVKRVMFEMADRGYAVIYSDSAAGKNHTNSKIFFSV